jgi:spermidine synthase
MTALQDDERLGRVGLVGLGTGALASYAGPGQLWTFFEIDPAVVRIAGPESKFFTYVRQSWGNIDIVLGDARLSLQASSDKFGLLVIDAFGSDAIPLHLLTREALQLYRDRLAEHGIVAFHISNRFVDLEPVLANLARDAAEPLTCWIQDDRDVSDQEKRAGKWRSVWVVMAAAPADLASLVPGGRWQPARPRADLRVWTDDYANLFSVLQLRE